MIDISRTRAGNYVTAVMLVAIATVLQALAIRFGGVNLPLVLYYPLLAGAAWATSFLFGMVATVVSGLLVWTLFLSDPAAYTQPLPDRLVRLGTFVLICALVCAIASMLRHARFTNNAALRREAAARRRLEAVLQALPQGVIATDTNGRLTCINAAAAALVGCRPDDAIGRAARDVLRIVDRDGRRVQSTPLELALGGEDEHVGMRWRQFPRGSQGAAGGFGVVVRQRARELGVDLSQVKSDADRVRHADLDAFLRYGASQGYAAPGASRARDDVPVRVIGMRRRIAENMAASKRAIPHFTYVDEIDVTELERVRGDLNANRGGRPKLTVLPLVFVYVQAVSTESPVLSSTRSRGLPTWCSKLNGASCSTVLAPARVFTRRACTPNLCMWGLLVIR